MAPQTPEMLIEQVGLTPGGQLSPCMQSPRKCLSCCSTLPVTQVCTGCVLTVEPGGNVHSCGCAGCRTSTRVCETRSPPPSLHIWMMQQLLDHWPPCRYLCPLWHSPRKQTPPPRMQGSGRHFPARSPQGEGSCAVHCGETCESRTGSSNLAAAMHACLLLRHSCFVTAALPALLPAGPRYSSQGGPLQSQAPQQQAVLAGCRSDGSHQVRLGTTQPLR